MFLKHSYTGNAVGVIHEGYIITKKVVFFGLHSDNIGQIMRIQA